MMQGIMDAMRLAKSTLRLEFMIEDFRNRADYFRQLRKFITTSRNVLFIKKFRKIFKLIVS